MFYIKKVKMVNFRAFDSKEVEFKPGINILYGKNASGKTSVVEGVSMLGLVKSFKKDRDSEIIKKGSKYYFINGIIYDEEERNNIVLSYSDKKTIKKNNYEYSSNRDYLGYFNVITFVPDDLDIIKGYPEERRNFMNVAISQIDRDYLISLVKYNKLLKTRNEYLKSNTRINNSYVDSIDHMMAEYGSLIIKSRKEFITYIHKYIKEVALEISSGNDTIDLEYNPSVEADNLEKELLNDNRQSGKTNVGPHRDDVIIKINNTIANGYASQGQIRSIAVGLKIACSKYLKNYNDKQIIILDDVLSELDQERQDKLLSYLKNDSQIFITTTSIDGLNKDLLNNSNLIYLEKEQNYE